MEKKHPKSLNVFHVTNQSMFLKVIFISEVLIFFIVFRSASCMLTSRSYSIDIWSNFVKNSFSFHFLPLFYMDANFLFASFFPLHLFSLFKKTQFFFTWTFFNIKHGWHINNPISLEIPS